MMTFIKWGTQNSLLAFMQAHDHWSSTGQSNSPMPPDTVLHPLEGLSTLLSCRQIICKVMTNNVTVCKLQKCIAPTRLNGSCTREAKPSCKQQHLRVIKHSAWPGDTPSIGMQVLLEPQALSVTRMQSEALDPETMYSCNTSV